MIDREVAFFLLNLFDFDFSVASREVRIFRWKWDIDHDLVVLNFVHLSSFARLRVEDMVVPLHGIAFECEVTFVYCQNGAENITRSEYLQWFLWRGRTIDVMLAYRFL